MKKNATRRVKKKGKIKMTKKQTQEIYEKLKNELERLSYYKDNEYKFDELSNKVYEVLKIIEKIEKEVK